MQIILLQNVENLGEKNDIKEVKDGYARNFLIPKGLAKKATKEALRMLERQVEAKKIRDEKELREAQKLVSKINGQEIIITVKVGEKEQLFESITTQNILKELKKLNFKIKDSQIKLSEPIKRLGEFPIKIKFEHNLEAEIKVIISKKND
jgi:large subunit ribosomal protein L9